MGASHTKLSADDYHFLETFLDATKANLFYAKGIIMIEGWAEEILIPALARKLKRQGIISKDLTEAGVSIVNVGSTAYLRYAKIFMRINEPHISLPVSVVTDIDVREYEKGGTKITSDLSPVRTRFTQKAMSQIEQNVKLFLAPLWTLEYSLYHSTSLSDVFQSVARSVHSRTDWDTDFEKKLAEKLIDRSLDKVEIAYQLARKLDSDNKLATPVIRIDEADSNVNYLVEAIKYACQS
jgi:putative ATP-dependent endonuclease of OLD family